MSTRFTQAEIEEHVKNCKNEECPLKILLAKNEAPGPEEEEEEEEEETEEQRLERGKAEKEEALAIIERLKEGIQSGEVRLVVAGIDYNNGAGRCFHWDAMEQGEGLASLRRQRLVTRIYNMHVLGSCAP